MLIPELLCPAGNMERLITCVTYGADAVYVGGTHLSLRAKTSGFSWDDLRRARELTRKSGRRLYFCLNVYPLERDIEMVKDYLCQVKEIGVDALIISDPGIIYLARDLAPHIPIHLSTQANTTNSEAVRFWRDAGIKRINLARELTLRDIAEIRKRTSPLDMELEVFVHGAMCMAISGRCYLSAYLTARSANRGECTHVCRFSYRIIGLALEEEKRQGEVTWEYLEEGKFSTFFAPEDLCLIKYLPWFVKKHIHALKIEGRMKTSSYLAPVVDTYATALRDVSQGRFRLENYLKEIALGSTRKCSTGFFLGKKRVAAITPARDSAPVVMRVREKMGGHRWEVEIKSRCKDIYTLEIMVPGLKRIRVDGGDYMFEDRQGNRLREVHSGMVCYLLCENPHIQKDLLIRKRGEG